TNLGLVQRIEKILRQSLSGFENNRFVQFGAPPADVRSGGFHGTHRGLRNFWANAVSRDQSAIVRHILIVSGDEQTRSATPCAITGNRPARAKTGNRWLLL